MAKQGIKGRGKSPFDIRVYKNDLRDKYKKIREGITPENRVKQDTLIFQHISRMKAYKDAGIVLCYVSMDGEISTYDFINQVLTDGKIVGVPYCVSGTREMEFYSISSLDDLERRTYGVLEPVPEKTEKITDFTDSICILPGLSFDKYGYRLGYGGGYYDRFLSSKYNGKAKIGACYEKCLHHRLKCGYYDVPCDYIITENGIKTPISKESKKIFKR